MAKFKNVETGNILFVKNEKTIAIMEKSVRYIRIPETAKTSKKDKKK